MCIEIAHSIQKIIMSVLLLSYNHVLNLQEQIQNGCCFSTEWDVYAERMNQPDNF